MTPDPTFAAAAASARESGTHAHEGAGWSEAAASIILAPWFDAIEASHARFRAELDDACRRNAA
jgi:hypothetical protein